MVSQTLPGQNHCFPRLFKVFFELRVNKNIKHTIVTEKFPILQIAMYVENGMQNFALRTSDVESHEMQEMLQMQGVITCATNVCIWGQHHSFQTLLQTFLYLMSFSRLFKNLEIFTLNSKTFQLSICTNPDIERLGVKFRTEIKCDSKTITPPSYITAVNVNKKHSSTNRPGDILSSSDLL